MRDSRRQLRVTSEPNNLQVVVSEYAHNLVTGSEILGKIKIALKGSFFRNVLVLMSGTALAQVITAAVAPILTRLYDPSAFGLFGLYASIVGIIGAVPTMRYDQALMLPKRTEDAATLAGVSGLCVVGVSILAVAVCIPFSGCIASITHTPDLSRWLWLVPVSTFLAGAYQTFNSWSTRRKQFHRASISQVVRSVAVAGSQTANGATGAGPMVLIGGAIFGEACAAVALGVQVLKDDYAILRRSFDIAKIKSLAKEYYEFPLYSGTQGILNSVSQSIPLLLLAHYFGSTTVGLYSLGVRILQLPMNLVLTSLRQVLFQKTSEVYNTGGDTYRLFKKTTLGLLALVIIPTVVVMLFAPPLFAFALGHDWYTAGVYARWLILWLALMFINVPAVLTAQIHRRQKSLFVQDVALLIFRINALVVGGLYCTALQTVILYSVVGAAFNAYIIGWMWIYLRRQPHPIAL